MDITRRLLGLDSSLTIHNEGFWKEDFDKDKKGFASFNDAGVECETGEFLYSLVRLLKPDHVLETGTHWGVGASYMGLALKDNNHGDLDTIEFLTEIANAASRRFQKVGIQDVVKLHLMDAARFEPQHTYKLILLDTEPQTRFQELFRFYDYLEPGGFVFIHDLHQHMHQGEAQKDNIDHPNQPYWPYGPMPRVIKQLVVNGSLRPFHFETPRGLTGFYKVSEKDYKWTLDS